LNFHTFQIPNVLGGTATRHLIRDEPDIPLAFLLTGINVNDSEPSLSQIDAIASIGEQSTNIQQKLLTFTRDCSRWLPLSGHQGLSLVASKHCL